MYRSQDLRELSRKFGATSQQRRFPTLYREQEQQQAAGLEAAQNAQYAPAGSIEQRENPFAYGTVFRRQNQGLAGHYDAQQAEMRQKQQEEQLLAQRREQAYQEEEQRKKQGLSRSTYNYGPSDQYDPLGDL